MAGLLRSTPVTLGTSQLPLAALLGRALKLSAYFERWKQIWHDHRTQWRAPAAAVGHGSRAGWGLDVTQEVDSDGDDDDDEEYDEDEGDSEDDGDYSEAEDESDEPLDGVMSDEESGGYVEAQAEKANEWAPPRPVFGRLLGSRESSSVGGASPKGVTVGPWIRYASAERAAQTLRLRLLNAGYDGAAVSRCCDTTNHTIPYVIEGYEFRWAVDPVGVASVDPRWRVGRCRALDDLENVYPAIQTFVTLPLHVHSEGEAHSTPVLLLLLWPVLRDSDMNIYLPAIRYGEHGTCGRVEGVRANRSGGRQQ
jgi:hypothetical protein